MLAQLHELLSYLNQSGVLTLIVVAQHGIVGSTMAAPLDVSYLADTVVMLRFFETNGEVRKAISILKKRSGLHEQTIREFRIRRGGLEVGKPLRTFQGILSGTPQYLGREGPLLGSELP